MKVTMTLDPSADNEIRFYDACKAAARKLDEIAEQVLRDGDVDPLRGSRHDVVEDNDDAETVGAIRISRR